MAGGEDRIADMIARRREQSLSANERPASLEETLVGAAAVTLTFLALWSLYRWSGLLWQNLLDLATAVPAWRAAGTAAVGFAGLALAKLRQKARRIYAFLEMGFALFTGFVALGPSESEASNTSIGIAFVGAIYLFVRGLTNWSEATSPKPHETTTSAPAAGPTP